jgi:hypothetical protein
VLLIGQRYSSILIKRIYQLYTHAHSLDFNSLAGTFTANTSVGVVYKWIMFAAFAVCGLVFIFVPCFCKNRELQDISKMDTAKSAGTVAAKGAIKGA